MFAKFLQFGQHKIEKAQKRKVVGEEEEEEEEEEEGDESKVDDEGTVDIAGGLLAHCLLYCCH